MVCQFTANEAMHIGMVGKWHLQRLRDDYQDLWAQNPDETAFWEEQTTNLAKHIETWENIMEKVSVGAK
jgi:hypothetical protein